MSEIAQASTRKEKRGLAPLLFGASAAPIAWLGQLILEYGISAIVCYPADHPVMIRNGALLRTALIGFDIVAVAAALAGALTALWCYRQAEQATQKSAGKISAERARFMALWGIFSSLCFLIAILFSIIASVTVPLCTP